MLTLLLYVLIVGLVAALLFLVASAVFGRSEELGPLPEGTTATVLPVDGISGGDVRALRFQQVLRGYKAGEVDWALTRLAARIDELEWQLAQATSAHGNGAAHRGTATPHGEYANGTAHHVDHVDHHAPYTAPYVPVGGHTATAYSAMGNQSYPAAPASGGQSSPAPDGQPTAFPSAPAAPVTHPGGQTAPAASLPAVGQPLPVDANPVAAPPAPDATPSPEADSGRSAARAQAGRPAPGSDGSAPPPGVVPDISTPQDKGPGER